MRATRKHKYSSRKTKRTTYKSRGGVGDYNFNSPQRQRFAKKQTECKAKGRIGCFMDPDCETNWNNECVPKFGYESERWKFNTLKNFKNFYKR